MACDKCRTLLSEGLDLCVRARDLDAWVRTNSHLAISSDPEGWLESGRFDDHRARHNEMFPDQPLSMRCGTIPLWLQDQYDKDLAEWERKARAHLMQGCKPSQRGRITIHLEPREDGGLRVWSPDLPGLVLSNADDDAVLDDIGPAVKGIWKRR